MKQAKLTLVFLLINFGGLAIGNWLMGNGATSDWYTNLNKAPWTPPGWVFGAAWTFIMICFSIYLGKLFLVDDSKKIRFIFLFQFLLNSSWNLFFFNQHLIFLSLVVILSLTAVLFFYFLALSKKVNNYKYLLLPYIIWLCIATSLNMYVLVHN